MFSKVLSLFFILKLTACISWRDTELFEENLLKNYNKRIGPPTNDHIKIEFGITEVDLDEAIDSGYTNLECLMSWEDSRLGWDLEEFNATYVWLELDDIWKPKLIGHGLSEDSTVYHFSHRSVRVRYNSTITTYLGMDARSDCVYNATQWPNYHHNCTVNVPPFLLLKGYDGSIELDCNIQYPSYPKELWPGSFDWIVKSFGVKMVDVDYHYCCPGGFTKFYLWMDVRRFSPWYTYIVLTSSCVLGLLMLIPWLMSISNRKRIIFGGIVMSMNLAYVCVFIHNITFSPWTAPLLFKNAMLQMLFSAMACGINACVFYMTKKKNPPEFKQGFQSYLNYVSKIFCVNTKLMKNLRKDVCCKMCQENQTDYFSLPIDSDWMKLIAVISRISFYIITAMVIGNIICYVDVLYYSIID